MTDDFPYKFDIVHKHLGEVFTISNGSVTIPIPPRYIRGFAERLMNIIDQYEKESDSKIDEKIASLQEQMDALNQKRFGSVKSVVDYDKLRKEYEDDGWYGRK